MFVITNTSLECPVELYDVKNHLRIDHDEDDYYLHDLINTAVLLAEHQTNRRIRFSTAQGYIDNTKGCVFLPYGNTSIVGVQANGSQLAAPNDFIAGADCIVFRRDYKDVVIDFDCGWSVNDTPADIRHAILMLVGTMYEQRQDITAGFQTFKAQFSSKLLLQHYKLWS
ncbi:head-tail connector protein [Moritella viscosa]|uniref:Uncharacterized protein n=1 Tax=Moritella viscosa TaxID=80854 RepID=A0A1L0C6K0_9GAMM|nr:head-tail connector protein [Moritella viscosa]SGZ16468.1 Putative uncharacterized protein [Moritella viscosa]SHO17771.1 Putative uncharacterized protein [Moritella viscosa]